MRSCVSFLTALALVLHLALGCCVHHAHGAVSHRHTTLFEQHRHGYGGADHDHCGHPSHPCHHGSPERPLPEQPPDERDSHCDEADCSVVVTGKADVTKDSLLGGPGYPVFLAGLPATGSQPRCRPEEAWKRVPALPVRAHLLHQSLLN